MAGTLPGEVLIDRLLSEDTRLCQADRGYLLVFFRHLGLNTVSDLRDIDCFEPVANYLRSSLEAFQKQQPQEAVPEGSGAVRAALGRLVRNLELPRPPQAEKAPIKAQQQVPGAPPVSSPPGGMVQYQGSAASRGRQQRQPQQQKTMNTRALSPSWGGGPDLQTSSQRPPCQRTTPPRAASPADRVIGAGYAAGRPPPGVARNEAYETSSTCSFPCSLSQREGSVSQLGTFSRAGSRQNIGRQTFLSKKQGEMESQGGSPGLHHYRCTMMCPDNRRPASPRATIGTARRDTGQNFGGAAEGPGFIGSPREEPRKGGVLSAAERFAYASRNRASWICQESC